MVNREVSLVWYSRCPLPTAMGIAIDTGHLPYELESLGVELKSVASLPSKTEQKSHFTHGVARLFRQGGNIPPIWARAQGADTALVGVSWTNEYQALLARPDSAIQRPEDLAARRLAVPSRSHESVDYWKAMCLRGYQAALELAGLTFEDVDLITLPVEDPYIDSDSATAGNASTLWSGRTRAQRQTAETIAFIRGEVDVIYTSGALGIQLKEQIKAREIVSMGSWIGRDRHVNNQTPSVLTVDRDLAQRHPEIVASFIRGLNHAADWAKRNKFLARRSVASDVGCAEEWLASAYGESMWSSLRVDLDPASLEAINQQKHFLLSHGFIANDFSVDEWIAERPMELSIPER